MMAAGAWRAAGNTPGDSETFAERLAPVQEL